MLTAAQQIQPIKSQVMPLAFFGFLSFALLTLMVLVMMPVNFVSLAILGLIGAAAFVVLPQRRRLTLALLIFVIPLNIDVNFVEKPSPGGADGLSFGLVEIFTLLLLVVTIVARLRPGQGRRFRFFPALLLPSLAILFFYFMSLINARDLLSSSFDIANFIKAILIFLLVANNIKNDADLRLVLITLFVGLMVQAVVATAMNLYPASTELFLKFKMGVASATTGLEESLRAGGSLGNSNHLGRYLGLLLPIAFMMVLTRQQQRLTHVSAAAALLGTYAIIFTLSRSAWLGLVFSCILLTPLMLHYRLFSFRTLGFIVVAFAVAGLFLGLYGDVILARLTNDDNGSAVTRLTTAQVAWAIIQDHPLFGCGINNYGNLLPEYWIGEDTFTRKAAVHNNYLLYMAEIGIAGFTAVLWWLVAFGARTVKAMRSANRLRAAVAVGIMAAYAGLLLESLTDKSYKENFTLLVFTWVLMAIIEAIIRLNGEKRHDRRTVTF